MEQLNGRQVLQVGAEPPQEPSGGAKLAQEPRSHAVCWEELVVPESQALHALHRQGMMLGVSLRVACFVACFVACCVRSGLDAAQAVA